MSTCSPPASPRNSPSSPVCTSSCSSSTRCCATARLGSRPLRPPQPLDTQDNCSHLNLLPCPVSGDHYRWRLYPHPGGELLHESRNHRDGDGVPDSHGHRDGHPHHDAHRNCFDCSHSAGG